MQRSIVLVALVCAVALPLASAGRASSAWASWAGAVTSRNSRSLMSSANGPAPAGQPWIWSCDEALNVTLYSDKCRTGEAAWTVLDKGICYDLTQIQDISATFGPDFTSIVSLSYPNTTLAGEGAVNFFEDTACTTPVNGFNGNFTGYADFCQINDPTTIDGSFKVANYVDDPNGELPWNWPIKSAIYNPSWCYTAPPGFQY